MIIRCAKCGSKNVVVNEDSKGYDLKKGLIGVALFGTGGAAMGINGKNQKYYHCQECGECLPYSMPDFSAKKIDEYLKSPDINKNILDMEKKIYPNIEWESTTIKKASFLTNDDYADALSDYMTKTNTLYLSDEQLEELFGVKSFGEVVNTFDACKILQEKEEKDIYIRSSTKSGCYYIRENFFKEVTDLLLEKIENEKTVRESNAKDIIYNYVVINYSAFCQDESILREISHWILLEIEEAKNINCDYSELYGWINKDFKKDFKLIPYDKEIDYYSLMEQATEKTIEHESEVLKIAQDILKDKEMDYTTLSVEIYKRLKEKDIASSEKEAAIITNYFLRLHLKPKQKFGEYKPHNIVINFENNIENPQIRLLSEDEEEELKKELEEANKMRKEKFKEEREKDRKEREEKQNRRMKELSLQYSSEILRVLKTNPGITVVEMVEKSYPLKDFYSRDTRRRFS